MSYTSEQSILTLIALLKKFQISKVIASPGTMNISFVGSIENDPFFTVYSAPDERSAAYMACGLSKESGEVIVITCTGATASRNYFPGLTEAFYSKLPILVVTCTQSFASIGQNIPQVLDRRSEPADVFVKTAQIPAVTTEEDRRYAEWAINDVINSVIDDNHGPGLLNMVSTCSEDFSVNSLPDVIATRIYKYGMTLPEMPDGEIGIYVSEHKRWTEELTSSVDKFCECHNAVVFCDRTSNYTGKYGVFASLVCSQDSYFSPLRNCRLLIQIGNVFGTDMWIHADEIWRVNPDGKIRNTFGEPTNVFAMKEEQFFNAYCSDHISSNTEFYDRWSKECDDLQNQITDDMPFSNAWIAYNSLKRLPADSNLHLGILNSLRCWSFFDFGTNIYGQCNTGGFGIDGCVSTLMGASLFDRNKLYFGVVGDLAFFYDMNVLGNHHVGNNIRLLVINNGKGTEFRMYNHIGNSFGDDADRYIAAGGHYGNKSEQLLKNYSENLGYSYLAAHNKNEFLENLEEFIAPLTNTSKAIVFEVFTSSEDESLALKYLRSLKVDNSYVTKTKIKEFSKSLLGESGVKMVKKIIHR